jgi:hypothetical protein
VQRIEKGRVKTPGPMWMVMAGPWSLEGGQVELMGKDEEITYKSRNVTLCNCFTSAAFGGAAGRGGGIVVAAGGVGWGVGRLMSAGVADLGGISRS